MKRILTVLLIGVMLITSLPVSAASAFLDVKKGTWYYETVTEMTEKGLFKGKGENQFCPEDTMTRAEFLAVVIRMAFPYWDTTPVQGEAWWHPVYRAAVDRYIIFESTYEFSDAVMNAPIPRQEMAFIIYQAGQHMNAFNADTKYLLPERIPDYNTIAGSYQSYVRLCMEHGLLNGIDEKGTFAPHKTLTRAEASTVLYRLLNAAETYEPITIYEGQPRYNRNAKPGDIFVKKDGTKIVLKLDQYGILGGGQGVAPDMGLMGYVGDTGIESFTYDAQYYGGLVDSTGQTIQNGDYSINATTGEGHWVREWQTIEKHFPHPYKEMKPGTYDGQISDDPYHLYVWSERYQEWEPNNLLVVPSEHIPDPNYKKDKKPKVTETVLPDGTIIIGTSLN